MTQVLGPSTNYILSDSTFKTRPPFGSYFKYDSSGHKSSAQQNEEKRRERHMKFPSLVGRSDIDSFKEAQNPTSPAYKRWNDDGDYRPDGPNRSCDNIIEPVSGFVSVAGDVDRNTGHTHIPTMVQLNTTPQSRAPQDINSIRLDPAAPPELQRSSENDRIAPYNWNSRVVLDGTVRSNLGGWTSNADPRKANTSPQQQTGSYLEDKSKSLRDKLALQYTYTSSTQRAFEEVPWDDDLKPQRAAPVSTLEERPDMISQLWTKKRYEPHAEEWQTVGRDWDRLQSRRGYFKSDIPIPGVVFCSPCPRARQIPLYSGCIGATNIEEIDNHKEEFSPLTVKRNSLPWPTDTAHCPNIPRYTGCTWYQPGSAPAFSTMPDPKPMTTARVHRPFTVEPNLSPYRRRSQMSRMITTVPPCNPFTKVTEPDELVKVTKRPQTSPTEPTTLTA